MPRVIFIRPAETDFDVRDLALGRSDPDLNDSGRLSANLTAEALNAFSINFIGVTPLKRAIATAFPIELEQEVFVHPVGAFQGADLGEWDGRKVDTIKSYDQARYISWLNDPDFPAPGGESLREVYARTYPELANIVSHAKGYETIALVLQNVVLRAMCCAMLDLPLTAAQRFYMDHGGFGVFERIYPGGPYQLKAWNHNLHLPKSMASEFELESELPGV